MGIKRITLVKNFREIMERCNFNDLKQVFNKCDVNATDGKYGSNAFGMKPLSREFAYWLKEQGGDINLKDYYGDAPIFRQLNRFRGNLPLMIELGADINVINRSGYTLLHTASRDGNIEDVKLLLEKGLNPNEKQVYSNLYKDMYTPLEYTLIGSSKRTSELLEVVNALTENGGIITDVVRNALLKRGEQFEFHRNAYHEDFIVQDSHALEKLYTIIGVTPVKKIDKHDGMSPIIISEDTIKKQYHKLWEYLVPSKGYANTGQGEAIRIAGKVAGEIMDNGGMNWDKEYKTMLDIFPQYFELGNKLSKDDLDEIKRIIKVIYKGNADNEPEALIDYAVKWVMQNQTVISVITPTYSR